MENVSKIHNHAFRGFVSMTCPGISLSSWISKLNVPKFHGHNGLKVGFFKGIVDSLHDEYHILIHGIFGGS